MATDRQIEANRRNAAHSTGPKTDEGKARSRLNATTHGLASVAPEVEAGRSPEFADRRALWAAEERPAGAAGNWALDRAVAASLRIDRCERTLDEVVAADRLRAMVAWEQDRELEAAKVFERLARNPVRSARQLMTTSAGVGLLLDAWRGLVAKLTGEGDWSEAERSRALDLFGVARDLRAGRTTVDAPSGGDSRAFRLARASGEIERLEALREEALAPLDLLERDRAVAGHSALLTKSAALILRYERDAWKRYREAIAQVRQGAEEPPPAAAPPEVEPAPEVEPEIEVEAEDAWLDMMERRVEALCAGRPPATEQTQFAERPAVAPVG